MRHVPPVLVENAKIFLLGEAPSFQEVRQGQPFVGPSGKELDRWLAAARIPRETCSIANVFPFMLPGDIKSVCVPGKELPHGYNRAALTPGFYLRPDYLPYVDETLNVIREARPNICIMLGGTATWALLDVHGLNKVRGFIHEAKTIPGLKVIPTYHPAAVLRQYELWPLAVFDIRKAFRESATPVISRPERWVSIPETPDEILSWWQTHRSSCVGCDIETAEQQITCISIAPNPQQVLVIPFHDPNKPDGNYWPTPAQEIAAWNNLISILGDPTVDQVFHNGSYDATYICHQHKVPIRGEQHDTMILHHAMELELPKSLANLGALYTSEPAWKLMRVAAKSQKKEDA